MIEASAVFPIIRSGFRNAEEVCGTGFFVSADGHFLTCAHLFEAVPQATYTAALDPSDLRAQAPIKLIANGRRFDLILAKVAVNDIAHLTLATAAPSEGDVLTASGFQGGTYREPDGTYSYQSVDLQHIVGKCTMNINDLAIPAIGQCSAKRFPALISVPTFPQGFSGGPVWNANSEVVGLHSNTNTDQQIAGEGEPVAMSVRGDVLLAIVAEHVAAK